MTNATQQKNNGGKFTQKILDISGLASKLSDWPYEAREVNIKHMKRMLANFETALLERSNNSRELGWFNNEMPVVKSALDACLKPRMSEDDLHINSCFAMEKLKELEQMAEDLDAKCAK